MGLQVVVVESATPRYVAAQSIVCCLARDSEPVANFLPGRDLAKLLDGLAELPIDFCACPVAFLDGKLGP